MTMFSEDDVRAALTSLSRIGVDDSLSRLRALDYRPRTKRRRTSAMVAAAGATTAGTVAALTLAGGQPAFAGWTATPTTATSAQSSTAAGNCVSALGSLPSLPDGDPTVGPWQPALTDVRGPFTVTVYGDQNQGDAASCFTGPSFTAVSWSSITQSGGSTQAVGAMSVQGSGAGGTTSSSNVIGSAPDIPELSVVHLAQGSNGPYTLVEGRVASGVTGVTLVRDDGVDVEATTGNGWLIAWWPGSAGVTSAEVTSGSGTASEPITLPAGGAPPPGPGSGSASGSA